MMKDKLLNEIEKALKNKLEKFGIEYIFKLFMRLHEDFPAGHNNLSNIMEYMNSHNRNTYKVSHYYNPRDSYFFFCCDDSLTSFNGLEDDNAPAIFSLGMISDCILDKNDYDLMREIGVDIENYMTSDEIANYIEEKLNEKMKTKPDVIDFFRCYFGKGAFDRKMLSFMKEIGLI